MVSPLGVVSPLVRMYCESLTKAPLVTNCVTAATLSVCSDAIAQKMEVMSASKEKTVSTGVNVFPYDVSRGLWMSGWGFVISGLFVHFWFMFLNSLFPVEGLTLVGALKKVFVNQFFMSPGLNSLFFCYTTFTRNDVPKETRMSFLRKKLAKDLVPTMKRSCAYWGTIQMVNFLYIPQKFSLLYTNVGFLIWTVYISLVGYRSVTS